LESQLTIHECKAPRSNDVIIERCIIKFLDKNLSEGLSKIGNNFEQHAMGDEVF
jgi:Flp pilus assembly CpaE family ATPase